jgi:hypothetical protein
MNLKKFIHKKFRILTENLIEMVENALTFNELPSCIKDNFHKNITMSVAFVKKDGTVRHMAFRRNLKSYVKSDRPKTDAQKNILINNNLLNVYDTNLYIKALQETQDQTAAAKVSYRNIKLDTVLAILCNGQIHDFRDRNKIMDIYGETVYNQLTKNMIHALNKDTENTNLNLPENPEI